VSSYIDTIGRRNPQNPKFWLVDPQCWADYTADRLEWLYGPQHAKKRARATWADIAAWNALGTRDAA